MLHACTCMYMHMCMQVSRLGSALDVHKQQAAYSQGRLQVCVRLCQSCQSTCPGSAPGACIHHMRCLCVCKSITPAACCKCAAWVASTFCCSASVMLHAWRMKACMHAGCAVRGAWSLCCAACAGPTGCQPAGRCPECTGACQGGGGGDAGEGVYAWRMCAWRMCAWRTSMHNLGSMDQPYSSRTAACDANLYASCTPYHHTFTTCMLLHLPSASYINMYTYMPTRLTMPTSIYSLLPVKPPCLMHTPRVPVSLYTKGHSTYPTIQPSHQQKLASYEQ